MILLKDVRKAVEVEGEDKCVDSARRRGGFGKLVGIIGRELAKRGFSTLSSCRVCFTALYVYMPQQYTYTQCRCIWAL